MGRVYEALRKNDRPSVMLGPDGAGTGAVAKREPEKERLADPESDQFGFVPYSLGAPSHTEIEELRRAEDLAGETRAFMTQPSKVVELDQDKIDPRLIARLEASPDLCGEFNKAAIVLISRPSENRAKKVLVTSAEHGSGKTITAINLALALAASRKRVLLFDCDFRRPSVHRLLGLEAELGLEEVIKQGRRPGDAAIQISPSGITIVPTRGPVENSAELLASPEFPTLLRTFEPDYDFILFDSNPLLHSAEARLLAPMVDAAILVISPGKVSASQLAKAIAPLSQEQVAGIVLNRVDRQEWASS